MPDIGETLRETRMRRHIDMSDVEAATKIRAKYLRALENEEWDLLPGPTFVKTFLRTYAEYLDLDPRLLVEEYRQRYERPTTQDLTPFGAGRGSQRGRRRQPRRRPVGPIIVGVLAVAILLGVLYLLGIQGHDNEAPVTQATPTPRATAKPAAKKKSKKAKKKPAAPSRVTLRLTASQHVYVCVVDASGKQIVNGDFLEAGQSTKTFRSRSFRLNLGNSGVRMIVGGKRYSPADTGRPVGYVLRPGKRPKRLSEKTRTGLCAT
jgi:cytoskeleton protein RodZ